MPLAADLLALVAPPQCAGCGRAGSALCAGCRPAFTAGAVRVPVPAWPGAPPALVCTRYQGVVAACVNAWKERGRHDLEPLLGRVLGEALAAAAEAAGAASSASGAGGRPAGQGGLLVVPVPTSRAARRRRGADGVRRLARHAAAEVRARGVRVRVLPALRLTRRVADQAGLAAWARAANVEGAFVVRRRARRLLAGRDVVVVDDVLTTGATMVAAARAVAAAGGRVVAFAGVSATPLRRRLSALPRLD